MNAESIIYCADAIARYENSNTIVLIERLGSVRGLALPGGKQEPHETLSQTIVREFFEETGLTFHPVETLKTLAEKNRDPRGRYVSTIFLGIAHGVPKNEAGKTKVVLYDLEDFEKTKHLFVFDHAAVISEYKEKFTK